MRSLNSCQIGNLEKHLKAKHRMHGDGILDSLKNTVSNIDVNDPKTKLALMAAPYVAKMLFNVGKYGVNKLSETISPGYVGQIPGESPTHVPLMNYMGPGTDAAGRIKLGIQPTNPSDACAQTHDLEYNSIQRQYKAGYITRDEANTLTRNSDLKLNKCLQNVRGQSGVYEGLANRAANTIISGKTKLEDAGLLDPGRFTGLGIKKTPLKNLRKKTNRLIKKNKNINSVLASIAADMLHKQQRGGNLKGVFGDIGNFFNNTIPDGFNKTFKEDIPRPFISAYQKTLGF